MRSVRPSIMRKARVQYRIRFGPFRTAHFRTQVDARFRRAFYSYLDQQVIPCLEGDIVRIGGRVSSHYDQPQFNDLAEVKHRYYYELCFVSDDNPQWCCGACGHYWGLTARALAKREILKRAPRGQR